MVTPLCAIKWNTAVDVEVRVLPQDILAPANAKIVGIRGAAGIGRIRSRETTSRASGVIEVVEGEHKARDASRTETFTRFACALECPTQ
jgi:hypothetical protein